MSGEQHVVTVQEYDTANGGKSYSLGINGESAGFTLYRDVSESTTPAKMLVPLLRAATDQKRRYR